MSDKYSIPSWDELFRVFPVSLHAALLLWAGWWARGAVDMRFIDYLIETCN